MITTFTDWIDKNPSSFASLIAAVIAASVAVLVFALTQYFTQKRERTNLLTAKLETLYLSLNQVAETNARFFKLVYLASHGNADAQREIAEDDLNLYGHRIGKETIMMIRLYFPKLSRIHQMLFAAQRTKNEMIFSLYSEESSSLDSIAEASGRVGHFIRLMEEEIIQNREHLIKTYHLFKFYKETTQEEIENEEPMPEGPIMAVTYEVNEKAK